MTFYVIEIYFKFWALQRKNKMSEETSFKSLHTNNLLVDNSNALTGRSTPVFGWSPLPVRKKLGCVHNESVRNNIQS